jgi:hypothetical protein
MFSTIAMFILVIPRVTIASHILHHGHPRVRRPVRVHALELASCQLDEVTNSEPLDCPHVKLETKEVVILRALELDHEDAVGHMALQVEGDHHHRPEQHPVLVPGVFVFPVAKELILRPDMELLDEQVLPSAGVQLWLVHLEFLEPFLEIRGQRPVFLFDCNHAIFDRTRCHGREGGWSILAAGHEINQTGITYTHAIANCSGSHRLIYRTCMQSVWWESVPRQFARVMTHSILTFLGGGIVGEACALGDGIAMARKLKLELVNVDELISCIEVHEIVYML